ncbi:MAG: bifunctional precorrin-2 dehydrogenase/sirohydrochlorin ferrochelatase [Planctomycetota bacterium]
MSAAAASIPVMLKLAGRRCVVVGGGPAAARRAHTLREAGAEVVVVAPRMDASLVGNGVGIVCHERGYAEGDLEGAFLVVVATDDGGLNKRVAADAAAGGALVNRADDAEAGDVTVMAHGRRGPLTVAVDTGHVSSAASKVLRDELVASVDEAWVELLEAARPYRAAVKAAVADATRRGETLRRLTDEAARGVLRDRGRAGLVEHFEALLDGVSGGVSAS